MAHFLKHSFTQRQIREAFLIVSEAKEEREETYEKTLMRKQRDFESICSNSVPKRIIRNPSTKEVSRITSMEVLSVVCNIAS